MYDVSAAIHSLHISKINGRAIADNCKDIYTRSGATAKARNHVIIPEVAPQLRPGIM